MEERREQVYCKNYLYIFIFFVKTVCSFIFCSLKGNNEGFEYLFNVIQRTPKIKFNNVYRRKTANNCMFFDLCYFLFTSFTQYKLIKKRSVQRAMVTAT